MNLAESWVGLRLVRTSIPINVIQVDRRTDSYSTFQGGEKYQQSFYVFEELAQAPSTSSTQTLVAQAVAEMHLGRTEEAQSALDQALQKDPGNTEAIANALVLQVIVGKGPAELTASLKNAAPRHPLLVDLEDKSSLFDTAAAKFSAKVSA